MNSCKYKRLQKYVLADFTKKINTSPFTAFKTNHRTKKLMVIHTDTAKSLLIKEQVFNNLQKVETPLD